jgi:predicted ribosomally synthesized peptide with nif11-like leader
VITADNRLLQAGKQTNVGRSTKMNSSMKKFLDAVSNNEELRNKVNGKDEAGVLAVAKETGFEITAEDLRASIKKDLTELSDDEMSTVAGGLIEPDVAFWICDYCNMINVAFGIPLVYDKCDRCGKKPG